MAFYSYRCLIDCLFGWLFDAFHQLFNKYKKISKSQPPSQIKGQISYFLPRKGQPANPAEKRRGEVLCGGIRSILKMSKLFCV